MTFPVYIEIGHSKLLLHALMELLAFFAGFQYFQMLKQKKGDNLSTTNRTWVLAGAILGALLGSRLLGGFENPPLLLSSKNLLLYFYENKTVVGGFLGGLAGVEIIKKIIGENKSSGDLLVAPILLALVIGRIGCFSMGVYEQTYGVPTRLPWGMNLGDGLKRHPVALYEMVYLLFLWIFIESLTRKHELRTGAAFKLFMIFYLAFRFFLDFIKPHYTLVFGLSIIQLACLAGLFYYRRDMLYPKRILLKQAHA